MEKSDQKRLFAAELEVRTGEMTFDYPLAIYADSPEEADEKAQEYAKTFYGECEEDSLLGEGYYEFDCGCIVTSITFLNEVADQGQWLSRFWTRFEI